MTSGARRPVTKDPSSSPLANGELRTFQAGGFADSFTPSRAFAAARARSNAAPRGS
jgi:hypothetical protein